MSTSPQQCIGDMHGESDSICAQRLRKIMDILVVLVVVVDGGRGGRHPIWALRSWRLVQLESE